MAKKKKHKKKQPVIPSKDTNERARRRIAEQARKEAAAIKRLERLREEWLKSQTQVAKDVMEDSGVTA